MNKIRNKNFIKNQSGFTMGELLIVSGIVAVLVTIALPNFSAQIRSARYRHDIVSANSARAAAEAEYLYRGEWGSTQTYYFDGVSLVSKDAVSGITPYGESSLEDLNKVNATEEEAGFILPDASASPKDGGFCSVIVRGAVDGSYTTEVYWGFKEVIIEDDDPETPEVPEEDDKSDFEKIIDSIEADDWPTEEETLVDSIYMSYNLGDVVRYKGKYYVIRSESGEAHNTSNMFSFWRNEQGVVGTTPKNPEKDFYIALEIRFDTNVYTSDLVTEKGYIAKDAESFEAANSGGGENYLADIQTGDFFIEDNTLYIFGKDQAGGGKWVKSPSSPDSYGWIKVNLKTPKGWKYE